MASRRAKYLLTDINRKIDSMQQSRPESESELTQTKEREEQTKIAEKQQMQEKLMANYIYKENQRQNERIDPDAHKKRVRDAERVLGREMYNRARHRVYGS